VSHNIKKRKQKPRSVSTAVRDIRPCRRSHNKITVYNNIMSSLREGDGKNIDK
jgi:hypothetical protein